MCVTVLGHDSLHGLEVKAFALNVEDPGLSTRLSPLKLFGLEAILSDTWCHG